MMKRQAWQGWLIVGALGVAVAGAAAFRLGGPGGRREPARAVTFPLVDVSLPLSHEVFPPGPGAEIANAQCLICHSAGMVMRQPPLTLGEWTAINTKMRVAYGAPLPAEQVDALARYLYRINGRAAEAAR
jgi:mono/diheme cytochrome c family protein